MLVQTDLLDPRPLDISSVAPMAGAVNIPAEEIAGRSYELPRRGHPLRVAKVEGHAQAMAVLQAMGREANLEDGLPSEDRGSACRLWGPSPWLEEIAPELKPGVALDLACGAGRDAVYLADLGWSVVAVDHLPDALEIARSLEQRYLTRPSIRWIEADLEQGDWDWPDFLGDTRPDLVTMFLYLHRPLIERAKGVLAPGGSLLIDTFTVLNRERHGKPRREHLALKQGELAELLHPLGILRHKEGWRPDGRHMACAWARAPESYEMTTAPEAPGRPNSNIWRST